MPFTPFHLGPGLLLKSALRERFSFVVFVFSQFVIDLETLWNILQRNYPLHAFFHSFVGSFAVIGICAATAPLAYRLAARILGAAGWSIPDRVGWPALLLSAALGAW